MTEDPNAPAYRPPVATGSHILSLPDTVLHSLEDIIPTKIGELAPLLERFSEMQQELHAVQTSHFALNVDPPPVPWSEKPASLNEEEFALASFMWDLHSASCGHYLAVWWRVEQLVRGSCAAVSSWELIVGAGLVRALLETAVVFNIEQRSLIKLWDGFRAGPFPDWSTIASFHTEAGKLLMQMIMATREERILEVGRLKEVLSRKSVLTFLKKVDRSEQGVDLSVIYEALCDAVHPSHGSNSVFWTKLDVDQVPTPQFQVHLARRAAGWSVVPAAVVDGLIWSLDRLMVDLAAFRKFTIDMCLTTRVARLPRLAYWGHVEIADPYELCPCGSGAKVKFCLHDFAD